MVKSFLIFISLQIFLYSSDQVILVVSDDINSTTATLRCFEGSKKVFNDIKVNIGKNGLGLGLGQFSLKNTDNIALKIEGDKKAPIGIFRLTHIFAYEKKQNLKMPYLHATKDLICVDDSKHKNYNQIINMPKTKPESFEYMKRNDIQYKLGIVVQHNKQQLPKRGSCIFLHIQKAPSSPTAGCTSMREEDIQKILNWLDINKSPILIQTPKSLLNMFLNYYPNVKKAIISE